MGIILGALGGAGEAMEAMGARAQTAQAAQDLETMRAGLETDKENRLHEYADQGVNGAKDYLTEAASQQVPQEAAPVTSLSGNDPTQTYVPDASDTSGLGQPAGFQGNPQAMLKTIQAWPDSPDKSAALAQLNRQFGADTDANEGIVGGQMRDRTNAESLDQAYSDALKDGNVKAATAIKAMQADKYTKVGKDEAILDRNGKLVFQSHTGADEAELREQSAERRANTRADGQATAAQIRADASERNTQARIDAMIGGLSKQQVSSWKDQFNTRMGAPGATIDSVLSDMGESKHKSDDALVLSTAAGLQANGLRPPPGDKTNPQVYAVQQAKLQMDEARRGSGPGTPPNPAAPSAALPAGQMPVGGVPNGWTPDGKQVWKMPNGRSQIAQ
jgi:hypothetical protein